MERVLEELKSAEVELRHPDEVKDRSAPKIEQGYHLEKLDRSGLLCSLQQGVPLQHVDSNAIQDRSQPVIAPMFHLEKSSKREFLTEVQAVGAHSATTHELKSKFLEEAREGGLPLKHVEAIHDTSVPNIPLDAHVGKNPMTEVLEEVREPYKFLNHVELKQVRDRSQPVIEAGIKVVQDSGARGPLMQAIEGGRQVSLQHVEPGRG